MRLDCIVEIDEAQQTDLTALAIPKDLLLVPHLHNCSNNAFCFTVGLGPSDPRKLLTNTELSAGCYKGMLADAFEFFTVVRISVLDSIGALIGNLTEKKLRTVLCLVREDASIQFPGKIIDGDEQILSW